MTQFHNDKLETIYNINFEFQGREFKTNCVISSTYFEFLPEVN